MNAPLLLTPESSAVHKYLDILQGVITRMATNSANCKSLCITLVSAIAVVITDKGKPDYAWITFVPVILFFFLDAYYLGLEQGFRGTYNEFIHHLRNGTATSQQLFCLIPKKEVRKRQADGTTTKEFHSFNPVDGTVNAAKSFAVYPFYLTLMVVLLLGQYLIFSGVTPPPPV